MIAGVITTTHGTVAIAASGNGGDGADSVADRERSVRFDRLRAHGNTERVDRFSPIDRRPESHRFARSKDGRVEVASDVGPTAAEQEQGERRETENGEERREGEGEGEGHGEAAIFIVGFTRTVADTDQRRADTSEERDAKTTRTAMLTAARGNFKRGARESSGREAWSRCPVESRNK